MNRVAAELAAEKSFNKLILKGRRLNVKWGKSQAQQLTPATASEAESAGKNLDPVPGLPGGIYDQRFVLNVVATCLKTQW